MGAQVTEHHTVVEAARRVPAGIVCLLSALSFHGLTTQAPHQVWMAIRGESAEACGLVAAAANRSLLRDGAVVRRRRA